MNYFSVYSKLNQYIEDYNQACSSIQQYQTNAQAEYNRLKAQYDEGLKVQLKKYDSNIADIQTYIHVAKMNCAYFPEVTAIKETNLSRLQQMMFFIDSNLRNDPHALELYKEAMAQLNGIEKQKAQLRQHYQNEFDKINPLKKQVNNVEATKKLFQIKSYLNSQEVNELVEELKVGYLWSAKTLDYYIGINYKYFNAPSLIEDDMKKALNKYRGIYNNGCLELPVSLGVNNFQFIVEYEDHQDAYILSVLRYILYYRLTRFSGISDVYFIDPLRYNNSSLETLKPLSSTDINLIHVAQSENEMKGYLNEVLLKAKQNHNQEKYIILHNYPDSYDAQSKEMIKQLFLNAKNYNLSVFISYNISRKYGYVEDIGALKNQATYISYHDNAYWYNHHMFNFFTDDVQLSHDDIALIRQNRPKVNRETIYEKRIGFSLNTRKRKGNRHIDDIALGVDENGEVIKFDFSGNKFATYIAGSTGSGKTSLIHALISEVVQSHHPDDIEMWLIDLKETEFSKHYNNHLPPHVRYLITDHNPEMIYDFLDKLVEVFEERKLLFKDLIIEDFKDVPSNIYCPRLFIIIDEFTRLLEIISKSAEYGKKDYMNVLKYLLTQTRRFGMTYIFAAQNYDNDKYNLSDISKTQIHQRFAMQTSILDIKATLNITDPSDFEDKMIKTLDSTYVLYKDKNYQLKKFRTLYIENDKIQSLFIDNLNQKYKVSHTFDPNDESSYVYKDPVIIDSSQSMKFKDYRHSMQNYLQKHRYYQDGLVVFPGTSARITPLSPVLFESKMAENALVIAPYYEVTASLLIMMSLAESAKMQGYQISLWSNKRNIFMRNYASNQYYDLSGAHQLLLFDEIEKKLSEIKRKIQNREESNELIFLFGLEDLLEDALMENEYRHDPFADARATLIAQGLLEDDGSSSKENSGNFKDNLIYVLKYGPRFGYHFVCYFNEVYDYLSCHFHEMLFKHQFMFKMARMSAAELTNSLNADVISILEEKHAFRYCKEGRGEGMTFKPFMHLGIQYNDEF